MTDIGKELLEELATIEDTRWADWQKWMHSKGIWHTFDGKKYLCFSPGYIRHLEAQISMNYSELAEVEKQSDRDQVMRYWPLIKSREATLRRQAELAGKIDSQIELPDLPYFQVICTNGKGQEWRSVICEAKSLPVALRQQGKDAR